ncbi:MAG: DUF1553 domain-containing protein [Pirellulales bacterium]
MPRPLVCFPALLALCVLPTAGVHSAEPVDYARDIKPLFAVKCGTCHGALEQEAGLRLDAGTLILAGGDSGAIVVPGDASASSLIARVASDDIDQRMPPEGEGEPLSAEQIALVTAWIDAGAVAPDDEPIPVDPHEHWAFHAPVRPPLPTDVESDTDIDADDASQNPIDRFLSVQQRSVGAQPVERADDTTLLRRVYFDLIGLPPSRAQQQVFAADESPDRWQRLVDELLASPHYGERWGRHWMDVWRYSDWDGYKQELRGSQRHIWRWRDWIVDSLNADKGYDRMIVEMLAGDELAPGDEEVLPATGFLGRNYHNSNRDMWLDATVEHTAKGFLGITLNCARCHEHKYDPIPQQAYYRFRAIFEPHKLRTDQLPAEPNLLKDGISRAFDAEPDTATYLYVRGNEKDPDKEHPLAPGVPDVFGDSLDVTPVSLPVETYFPALRRFAMEQQLATADQQLAAAQRALSEATTQAAQKQPAAQDQPDGKDKDKDKAPADVALLEHKRDVARANVRSLEARQAADRSKYLTPATDSDEAEVERLSVEAAWAERAHKLAQARLAVYEQTTAVAIAESSNEADEMKKQKAVDDARKKLEEANKALAEAEVEAEKSDGTYTHVGEIYPASSTGRRLALARWITAAENPLAARVAVNHIWLRHFGTPLVENVFDFGLRSPRPRHVELLDWLAVELIENGWSTKHLHRLILTSDAWQRASAATGDVAQRNLQVDPDNQTFWRMNVRRLEAEIVRDNVLAVSGDLDPQLGGPEIPHDQGETSPRRSIYLQTAYEKQMTMLVDFDAASPNECYRRSESIVPQQALALANSTLTLDKSRVLAGRLWEEVNETASADAPTSDDTDARFVDVAYRQIFSRPPQEAELAACRAFLREQSAVLAQPASLTSFVGGAESKVAPADDAAQRARENLIHVLMNHNDFVTAR